MNRRLSNSGPTLVAEPDGTRPKLIYDDGFFLIGQTWQQLEEQIALECGLSRSTVRKHLAIAERGGWIKRIKTSEGVGIKFLTPEVEP